VPTLGTQATTLLLLPRDIVARGRTLARIALTLLLAPQLLLLLVAVPAGEVSVGGETARAVVWTGMLYLVYRGFRLTRWLVLVVATVSAIASSVMEIRNLGREGFSGILWLAIGAFAPAAGITILLAAPSVRSFFIYQLGGKVPEPIDGRSSRGLTSA
jgi:hypothetical protein